MQIIHSLILCSGGEQGSWESAFTATCLPSFSSLLPFLLMHFKGKRDKNTWLAMIFCHLFSCLMEAALTDSRKVCVAVHYFQKNLNVSVFSQMQNAKCDALKTSLARSWASPSQTRSTWAAPRCCPPADCARQKQVPWFRFGVFHFFETAR